MVITAPICSPSQKLPGCVRLEPQRRDRLGLCRGSEKRWETLPGIPILDEMESFMLLLGPCKWHAIGRRTALVFVETLRFGTEPQIFRAVSRHHSWHRAVVNLATTPWFEVSDFELCDRKSSYMPLAKNAPHPRVHALVACYDERDSYVFDGCVRRVSFLFLFQNCAWLSLILPFKVLLFAHPMCTLGRFTSRIRKTSQCLWLRWFWV